MSEKTGYESNPPADSQKPPDSEHPQPETESLPVYESQDLLRGQKEIVIRHQGEVYRLRLTRSNKLILNK